MPEFAEIIESEDDSIADWIIEKVVDEKDDEEKKPKEVIKIEQIYVTKDEVDSSDFILGVLLVVSIIIATIVIVLLLVCIYRTFSSQREAKLHKKIKEKTITQRALKDENDSEFETQKTVDIKSQYTPAGTQEEFYGKRKPNPPRDEEDPRTKSPHTQLYDSTINLEQEDKKEPETDRNQGYDMKDNMVTIGQSDITPTDGNTALPTIGQDKGEFRTGMIDDLLSKKEKPKHKTNVDAKMKSPTKTKDGAKGSPRKQVVPLPKNENMLGATQQTFLGGDIINAPIEESPSKIRATSVQQKTRPGKQPTSPYLQN